MCTPAVAGYRVDCVKGLLGWRVEVVLAVTGLAYLGRTNTKLLKYRMYLELPHCTKYKGQSRWHVMSFIHWLSLNLCLVGQYHRRLNLCSICGGPWTDVHGFGRIYGADIIGKDI